MEHCKLALAILLVICATYGAAGSAPRALLQGRSADAPGQNDDAELPRGRPEDVAAVGELCLCRLCYSHCTEDHPRVRK